MSLVYERLYLGNRRKSEDRKWLLDNGIRLVVNCTDDLPSLFEEDFLYLRIPLKDLTSESLYEQLDVTNALLLINRSFIAGDGIFVHCRAGSSRSAAVVLAYLVKYRDLSLWDAFTLVNDVTPIKPNSGFLRQLVLSEGEAPSATIDSFGNIKPSRCFVCDADSSQQPPLPPPKGAARSTPSSSSLSIHPNKANKSQHNFVFAAWLVKTFGQQMLRSSEYVLDLAAGKGDLGFELSVRYGINTVIIDEREPEVKLNSMQRRRMKRICKSRSLTTYRPAGEPAHSRNRSPLMEWMNNCTDLVVDDDCFQLQRVQASVEDDKSLPFVHTRMSFPIHYQKSVEPDGQLTELFSKASVVVGMHADQVTESLVDHALRFNKPFAVVPCCVFPSLFPHRRTLFSDVPVTSYHDFIEYLLKKDVSIQATTLPFEGSNVVLYRTSAAVEDACV